MKLYIVRHGVTDWNTKRLLQGISDIPLNEFGRHLAVETGKGLKDIPFAFCYSSPLVRAKETAELILKGRDVPIQTDIRIQEVAFGEYEGKCCSKDGWNLPDEFEKFFNDTENYAAPEGGEDLHMVKKRVGEFLEDLKGKEEEFKDSNVLVATHGTALCAMINYLLEEPVSRLWGEGVHRNCAVTIVELKDGTYTVLEQNKVYYKDEVEPW